MAWNYRGFTPPQSVLGFSGPKINYQRLRRTLTQHVISPISEKQAVFTEDPDINPNFKHFETDVFCTGLH